MVVFLFGFFVVWFVWGGCGVCCFFRCEFFFCVIKINYVLSMLAIILVIRVLNKKIQILLILLFNDIY
jgi:hypothetical protein